MNMGNTLQLECPPFFPLEGGIFYLAIPLNFRGEKGVSPKQKCRGLHAPIVALLRGKSVTHVMRSCLSRAGDGVRHRELSFRHATNPGSGTVWKQESAITSGR